MDPVVHRQRPFLEVFRDLPLKLFHLRNLPISAAPRQRRLNPYLFHLRRGNPDTLHNHRRLSEWAAALEHIIQRDAEVPCPITECHSSDRQHLCIIVSTHTRGAHRPPGTCQKHSGTLRRCCADGRWRRWYPDNWPVPSDGNTIPVPWTCHRQSVCFLNKRGSIRIGNPYGVHEERRHKSRSHGRPYRFERGRACLDHVHHFLEQIVQCIFRTFAR
jgi:hypothetical protein